MNEGEAGGSKRKSMNTANLKSNLFGQFHVVIRSKYLTTQVVSQ